MSTWLLVNGFVILALTLTLLPLSFLIYFDSEKYHNLFFGFLMTLVFTSAFRISWVIVGGVMYFGFLFPKDQCSDSATTYLFVSIIMSMAMVLGNCMATRIRSDMEMKAVSQEAE